MSQMPKASLGSMRSAARKKLVTQGKRMQEKAQEEEEEPVCRKMRSIPWCIKLVEEAIHQMLMLSLKMCTAI